MELAGSGYLYTLVVIATTFAGFAGMTMIFRQVFGGHVTRLDSFVVRTFIQLGFLSTFASLLPPLLAQFGIAPATSWRVSSAVYAILLGLGSFTFPRRRNAASPTRAPTPIWCVVIVLDIAALALAANVIFPLSAQTVGIYSAAATVALIGGATFFLFSLIFLFERPLETMQPGHQIVRSSPKTKKP
jgi:hypothetical protein